MSAIVAIQPPRTMYAGAMTLVALGAGACAFVAARAAEADSGAAPMVGALVGAVSLLGLLPALARTTEHFGLAVLGASILRMLVLLAAAVLLTEVAGQPSRPVWFGVVGGALAALIAESIVAVAILAAAERKKSGAPRPGEESRPSC